MIDVAIIGAGMAGAGLAARLAPHRSVALLEAEDAPGRHATGRSAAFWTESYGGPAVQPLTAASRAELERSGVLSPRGALHVARSKTELSAFAARYAEADRMFHTADPQARVPGLSAKWSSGLAEATCTDIDVAALHAVYLSSARTKGATLHLRWRLAQAERRAGAWQLVAETGERLTAAVLVDAAGAWADQVAERAGVSPLCLSPLRRTVVQLRLGRRIDPSGPLVLALDESLYWKPVGAERIWLSPSDESPSAPCDAAPEEIDVATALDRFGQMVDWPVAAVERRWSGLRTFAPDRAPVIGWDRATDGFFWLAGQGGWGIQTAPAVSDLAARVLLGAAEPGRYDPARLVSDGTAPSRTP